MATRTFGQIAAFVKAATPPTNTEVLFYATGADGNWPIGFYMHSGVAWVPIGRTREVAVTNSNVTVDFRIGNVGYTGTPSGNITVTPDLTGAQFNQTRTMVLVGNGVNTVTFDPSFRVLAGSQAYNNQLGVVNIINLCYRGAAVGVTLEISQ